MEEIRFDSKMMYRVFWAEKALSESKKVLVEK